MGELAAGNAGPGDDGGNARAHGPRRRDDSGIGLDIVVVREVLPGRPAEAEAHAERSLALKPQNPPVYVVLGYTLLRQKKAAEAEEAFRHFLKMAPSSPMAPDVKQALVMIEQHEQQTRRP